VFQICLWYILYFTVLYRISVVNASQAGRALTISRNNDRFTCPHGRYFSGCMSARFTDAVKRRKASPAVYKGRTICRNQAGPSPALVVRCPRSRSALSRGSGDLLKPRTAALATWQQPGYKSENKAKSSFICTVE